MYITSDGFIMGLDELTDGELKVPAIFDGITVVKVGRIDESITNQLTKIVIPKTVQKINSFAFADCVNLSEVIIEDDSQLGTIMEHAFEGCEKLKTFPFDKTKNLILIGHAAFSKSGLEKIDLSKTTVETIGGESFNLESLKSVVLPSTLAFIGDAAFENAAITELDLSVVANDCEIHREAFCHNTFLKNIKFSDSKNLNLSGQRVFARCYELEEVTIPSTVNIIDEECFSCCHFLKTVHFLKGNSSISKKLPCYTFYGCGDLSTVDIDYPFSLIGDYAFYLCGSLKKVSFPTSIKRIGRKAFSNCSKLNLIDLSACDVEAIQGNAFEDTSFNLSEFKMDYFSSTKIDSTSFEGNSNIKLNEMKIQYPFCCIM